jgi:uncharacterized protein YegL
MSQHLHTDCFVLYQSSTISAPQPAQLQQAFEAFTQAIAIELPSNKYLDICVMSYGDEVKTELDFVEASDFHYVPKANAQGKAVFNKAIGAVLRKINERERMLRRMSIIYKTPVLFVLSDGSVSDEDYSDATRAYLKQKISNHNVIYVPISIGDTNEAQLASYSPQESPATVICASLSAFRDAILKALGEAASEDDRIPLTPSTCGVIEIGL